MLFRSVAVIAFVLAGAAGCGLAEAPLARLENVFDPVSVPESHVDPELLPHVASFRAAAAAHGRSLDEPDRLRVVLIGDPELRLTTGGEVGLCTQRRSKRPLTMDVIDVRTVVVLEPLLERPLALRRTIYHELGHCLLGLTHAHAKTHRSIMAAKYVGNSSADEMDWDALVAELFDAQER